MFSVLPLAAVLLLLGGDLPDPDRNAHDMWARQLVSTGSLTISENGTTEDWRLYYPNTVPKPLELGMGLLRIPGGALYRELLTLMTAALVLTAAYHAAGKGDNGKAAAVYLGLNPVYIFLAVRGNPAIPFMGAVFLLYTMRGRTAGTLIAALSRPEGFIYGGWLCLRERNWKRLMIIAAAAAVWLVFHKTCTGSFIWTSEEVRYSVAAMAYPTPNPITFLPWAGLRSILILGAPAAAIFYGNFRQWQFGVPFLTNLALLTVSLALGSLVLPRYIDQLFLLAVPFVFLEIGRLFKGGKKKLITAAVIAFPAFQWISAIPEIAEYVRVRDFYYSVELPETGAAAANELLIPGMALANDIYDPRGLFVSTDRAAWENAEEADLREFGVSEIIILREGIYFPEHTEEWLENIKNIKVVHYGEN